MPYEVKNVLALKHEMAGTTRVFGRESGLNVQFRGEAARTDGKTVYLPDLPDDHELSKDDVMIARGYVDHESEHVTSTDVQYMKKIREKYGVRGGHLLNALEDVRIDTRKVGKYEGARKNLRATATKVNQMYLDMHKEDTTLGGDIARVLPAAITWDGRQKAGIITDNAPLCLETLEEEVGKLADEFGTRVQSTTSTKDCYELACELAERLEIVKEDEDEGDGEGDVTVEEGESKGERGVPFEMSEAIDQTFEIKFDADKTLPYMDLSRAVEMRVHDGDPRAERGLYAYKRINKSNLDEYNTIVAKAAGAINVLRRKLERLLAAQRLQAWETGQLEGRIDSRALASALVGNERIFKKKAEDATMDTAVMVLVDLSGSMGTAKAKLAGKLCIVLAETMSKMGVPFAVYGFDNNQNSEGDERKTADYVRKYINPDFKGNEASVGRRYTTQDGRGKSIQGYDENLRLTMFKDFSHTLRESREYLAAIRHYASGNNIDGAAVLWANERLKKRLETKRVLLVLSDGQPAGRGDGHARQLRSIVRKIEQDQDTYIAGIGIMTDAVEHFYKNYSVCHSLSQVGEAFMGHVGEGLLRKHDGRKRRRAA